MTDSLITVPIKGGTLSVDVTTLAAALANSTFTATPVAPPVIPPAASLKTRMIRTIAGLKDKGALLGQHLEIFGSPNTLPGSEAVALAPITAIKAPTGKNFAVWGLSLNTQTNTSWCYDLPTFEKLFADCLAAGAIPQVTWFMQNPMAGSTDNNTPIAAANFANIVKAGTAENTNFLASIKTLMAELKKLNSPFLFRLLAEMNGTWTWYGNQDPATFQKVFVLAHDTVMADAQLASLVIWTYCTNNGVGRYADYFPGKPYVDFCSIDNYGAPASWAALGKDPYTALQALGLPIYFAEAGLWSPSNPLPAVNTIDLSTWASMLTSNFPDAVMMLVWCQTMAAYEQMNPSALLNGTKMLTLDEIPPFV